MSSRQTLTLRRQGLVGLPEIWEPAVYELIPIGRHRMPVTQPDKPHYLIRYFEYGHLPEALQIVSARMYGIAIYMDAQLPDGPEKSAGLRKLLEAKDCFVRSALDLVEGAKITTKQASRYNTYRQQVLDKGITEPLSFSEWLKDQEENE